MRFGKEMISIEPNPALSRGEGKSPVNATRPNQRMGRTGLNIGHYGPAAHFRRYNRASTSARSGMERMAPLRVVTR